MIVLDASVLVEVLLHTDLGEQVRRRWQKAGTGHAPHLAAVEVSSILRKMSFARVISVEQGQAATDRLSVAPYQRHGHNHLLDRIWELRDNVTAYDATYVALAEALGAPLLTCDAKLAAAPGHRATIELITL